jgi:hypothetical protein
VRGIGLKERTRCKLVIGLIASLVAWQWPNLTAKTQATHAGTHMMLFWDGGAAPSGWSIVTTFDGRFPRGESAANYGVTGGNATHTPTTSSISNSIASTQRTTGGLLPSAKSDANHDHNPTATTGNANNLPAFRSLKMIRFDAGMPDTIPAGAIAIFDDNPGLPSGWTRQSAQDGNMVRVNNSVATGGSDTHTHSVTWNNLSAAAQSVDTAGLSGQVVAPTDHTHNAPSASSTVSMSAVPPYIQVIVGKADTDKTPPPPGMIAMFDGAPGEGWDVRSNSGGTFYQQFIRGAASFNGTSQGSATHSHASVTSGASGGPSATAAGPGTGTGSAGSAHTHTLTADFNAGTDNIPEYVNVVYAERIAFTLNAYRWYADSDAQDVTDPVGAPDVAQNTAITPIPVPNAAPGLTGELRLRTNIIVSGGNLAAGAVQFKMQYKQGTDGSCTSGSWTDVGAGGGGSAWRFASSSVADGTNLTVSRLSPTSSVLQDYVKAGPSVTNANAATPGQTIEYDFHIEHNGAVDAAQYSFRIIQSIGTVFDGYSSCPTLVTAPGSDNFTRGGQFWSDQVRSGGYFWAD